MQVKAITSIFITIYSRMAKCIEYQDRSFVLKHTSENLGRGILKSIMLIVKMTD